MSVGTITGIFYYLLTPWSRVLLEKLTSLQLVKKFPAFYGTRRFITALKSARHLSLSWASPIQSSYRNPTSWRSILILSSHLRLGLPSGLFPSGFPTSTLYTLWNFLFWNQINMSVKHPAKFIQRNVTRLTDFSTCFYRGCIQSWFWVKRKMISLPPPSRPPEKWVWC